MREGLIADLRGAASHLQRGEVSPLAPLLLEAADAIDALRTQPPAVPLIVPATTFPTPPTGPPRMTFAHPAAKPQRKHR